MGVEVTLVWLCDEDGCSERFDRPFRLRDPLIGPPGWDAYLTSGDDYHHRCPQHATSGQQQGGEAE